MPYHHLTLYESKKLFELLKKGYSIRAISKLLSRAPSTLSREIKRNRLTPETYWHKDAKIFAKQRRSLGRNNKLMNKKLYAIVMNNITKGYSPKIISGRLKREYRSLKMRISAESIYQWIYNDARAGGHYFKHLIRHHKNRKKQRHNSIKSTIRDRIGIEKRPKIVADKKRFGDWESDSMNGGKGKGGLTTHVERKSRYLVAGKIKNGYSETYIATSIALFKCINPST